MTPFDFDDYIYMGMALLALSLFMLTSSHEALGGEDCTTRVTGALRDALRENDLRVRSGERTENPPPIFKGYLNKHSSQWFRTSVEVPSSSVDPYFVELAKRQPNGELVIYGGSDVPQIVLGVHKTRAIDEVNRIIPHELWKKNGGVDTWTPTEIEVPAFQGEPAGNFQTRANPEGAMLLELMASAAETSDFRPPLSPKFNLMVPIKGDIACVVRADGSTRLYFRTPEAQRNYEAHRIWLPNASHTDPILWIRNHGGKQNRYGMKRSISYSVLIRAMGARRGWRYEPDSLIFLKGLVRQLNESEKHELAEDILEKGKMNDRMTQLAIPKAMQELGLIQTAK